MSEDWTDVLAAMAGSGADAVEVGIPFSDPLMDGPTVQEAATRALARGTTPVSILDELARLDVGVPVVAMTAYNLVFRMGEHRFARSLAVSGVAGAIVPDLPLDESASWEAEAGRAGVETVLLAAPVTTDRRLAEIVARSRGFVYGVSVMGTTGERTAVAASAMIMAKRLKAATDLPVAIGFGVSTPEQAAEIATVADGVVVGAALVRIVLDGGEPEDVGRFVASLRAGLDAAC
jgi:tryptophan synthase alpha chain